MEGAAEMMPQIDWTNPITRGLTSALVFNEAGGTLHDLLVGKVQFASTDQPVIHASAPGWVVNSNGHAVETSQGGDAFNGYGISWTSGPALNNTGTAPGDRCSAFQVGIALDSNARGPFLQGTTAANQLYLSTGRQVILRMSSGDKQTHSVVLPTLPTPYAVGFFYDTTQDLSAIFVNGVFETAAQANWGFGSNIQNIGDAEGSGFLAAQVSLNLVWGDRALTEQEFQSLYRNPWQIFKRQPIIGAHQLPTHVDYGKVKMPWTEQPPAGAKIDWNNSITEGLKVCVVPSVGFINLVDGVQGTAVDDGYSRGFQNGQNSFKGDNADSTAGGVTWPLTGFADGDIQQTVVTLSSQVQGNSEASGFRLITVVENASIYHQLTQYYGTFDATAKFDCYFRDNAATNYIAGGDVPLAEIENNNLVFCASTVRSSTWVRRNLNGYWAERTDATVGSNFYPTQFALGCDGTASITGTAQADDTYLGLFWGRSLSDAEIESLHKNPWQIFKPQEIYAPINQDLPDLVTWEEELKEMPWKPPL